MASPAGAESPLGPALDRFRVRTQLGPVAGIGLKGAAGHPGERLDCVHRVEWMDRRGGC